MKVTELYYLIENLRYILLSEHVYFPAISPFLSDRVTNDNYIGIFSGKYKHQIGYWYQLLCEFQYRLVNLLLIAHTTLVWAPLRSNSHVAWAIS